MNLLDSLLDAIVRLEGDALVMHVGEKPYVVTTTSAMSEHRGPLLWGHVDLSSRVLTSEAVLGMLGQIMPLDQRQALDEVGAVEHYLETERVNARFSVIAARAGDEVWLEVRKRPKAVPVAVAAEQPVIDQRDAATESVAAPQIDAAPIEPPVELPVETRIEEPVSFHDTVQAVDQPAIIESPAALDGELIEDEVTFDAPALAIAVGREHRPAAPFEIVHEVNQDAPTDADVDELLAASAAALLRTAAPAVAYDPLDVGIGAWRDIEEEPEALAVEPEPEPVLAIAEPEAVMVAHAAPRVVRESIAVADDFRLTGEPTESLVPADATEFSDLETVAMSLEPRRLLAIAEAEPEPAEATESLAREAVALVLPEPVAEIAKPERAPAPVMVEDEGVAFAPEPEPVPVSAEPQPVAVAAEPERASEPEPAHIVAETEPQPGYIEPEPVVAALESEHVPDAPQPAAATYESDPPSVPVQHEQPVMASLPPREPEKAAERAVIVPLTPRLPAVAPRGEAGGAKAGAPREHPSSSTTAHPSTEFSIDELLRAAAARGASTVYLVAQSRPMVRAEGDISALDIGAGTPLDESDITRLMLDFAPAPARDAWQSGASAEWISDIVDVGRVRCMTFRDHRGPGLLFRMIPAQAISADQLGLTQEVAQALCAQSDGLVLVTGPRASGKSTLMSGLVDLINRTRSDHVITIESQIQFVHESRRSFVSQREVREGDEAVVSAVCSALREDPDVLFIGDLSSAEVAAVALDAAESGRLVFASLAATSTVAAIDRLLELLPADRVHARASIAASLRGVVAQVLVGRTRGGRAAAREVLLNTAAVAGLIQEAKTDQLPLAMESGRRHGMMPLNDALTALVREGTVHVTEAYRKAFDKESLLAALRQEGIDTSFAEKIA